MTTPFVSGLEGIVAAQTRKSHADGLKGELILGGYLAEELAPRATFEEVVYLLLNDSLPNAQQLADFTTQLTAARKLSPVTLQLLEASARQTVDPMDALLMAAATLNLNQPAGRTAQAISILAKLPVIVAMHHRLSHGQRPVIPDAALGQAANYLYMLTGKRPNTAHVRGMDTYLNTVADHDLNASTFTARVIIATQSDLVSAIVGALGALKGPLHGGAPGPALDMVFEIARPERADAVIKSMLTKGDRLMGFGHRVYKVRDPRADILGPAARELYTTAGDMQLYNLATYVEQRALVLLEEHKPGRHLQTNVEFYTALLLHGLGLPTKLFTPTFAVARAAGWLAHCFEQLDTGRLIRPSSEYIGPRRGWVPLEQR